MLGLAILRTCRPALPISIDGIILIHARSVIRRADGQTPRTQSRPLPMTERERDYIGFDPVAWVERLIEVNRGSQFLAKDKAVISAALSALKINLEANGAR